MRVRDQLVYLGSLSLHDPVQTARSVDRWLDRLGLAARGRDRVDALSHGNQQRVQLIAALVVAPELLVLDEPFAGLDPLAITSLGDLLREVADDGVTVLFSSHQLDLVEDICEDVVIIDGGRVVHAGDLAQLRAAAPDRLVEVRYGGAAPDLTGVTGLRGVEVLDTDAGRVRLRVDRDTEVAAVVAHLRGSSEVVSFSYRPPSLTELFREAVGS
jgi:ABC-2 type transport system ATP-binding protein